jgi:hypothetical protein
MLKYVDKVDSMVVSATFVCRYYFYADEILIKFDEYLTGSGRSISVCSIS